MYKVHLKGERGDGKGEVFSVSKIQDVHVRLPPYRDLPVPPIGKILEIDDKIAETNARVTRHLQCKGVFFKRKSLWRTLIYTLKSRDAQMAKATNEVTDMNRNKEKGIMVWQCNR